jgi:cell division protein FtsB
MNYIKKHWQIILIALLLLFGMNKCTVSCNRANTINKQQTEIVQKDSIIKVQSDSLNILKIRWTDAQKSQDTYQGIAMGNQQELVNTIGDMKNTIETMNNKIQTLTNENTVLKRENKQLKDQLK